MALRRSSAPARPIAKSAADAIEDVRQRDRADHGRFSLRDEHEGADERREEKHRERLEGEEVVGVDGPGHVPDVRRGGFRRAAGARAASRAREEGHEDDREDEDRPAAQERWIGRGSLSAPPAGC